jgi:large subunit ribosomal protein L25
MAHEIPTINAQQRERVGTRDSARLREAGRMPAVIYGHKKDPAHISVDSKEMIALLRDKAHVIEVTFDGNTEPCLVRDMQWDYLGDSVIHLDLARVDMTERVTVDVEVALVGDPIGLKEANTYFDTQLSSIEIECLANQIPENLTADISDLGTGQSLLAGQVPLPDGITLATAEDAIVCVVILKGTMEDEDEEGELEPSSAEPEVIGGKKPEEGGE